MTSVGRSAENPSQNDVGAAWPSVTPRRVQNWPDRYRHRLLIADAGVIALALTPASILAGAGAQTTVIVAFALVWYVGLAVVRSRSPRILGAGSEEYSRTAVATVSVFGAAIVVASILHRTPVGEWIAAVFSIGLVGLIAERWLLRRWLVRSRRAGRFRTRVLVLGEPSDAARVIDRMHATGPAAELLVVGAVLPHPGSATSVPTRSGPVPIVSSSEHIGIALAASRADAVVVAGTLAGDHELVRSLAWSLEGTAVRLILAPGLTDVAGPRVHLRHAGVTLVHVEPARFSGGRHVVKRALDIVLSATALLVLAPLLAGIALRVAAGGDGPVLFRQSRVGHRGEPFTIVKFRTMVPDAELRLAELRTLDVGAGPLFKVHDDPRVTSFGRTLRRYSLDELPQLWNVLRGSMSMVGPRPPLASEVSSYTAPAGRRLLAKPGITGIWQISGRSDLDWDESVRLDLSYVENWSVAGDLLILWRTVRVVLRPRGAY